MGFQSCSLPHAGQHRSLPLLSRAAHRLYYSSSKSGWIHLRRRMGFRSYRDRCCDPLLDAQLLDNDGTEEERPTQAATDRK